MIDGEAVEELRATLPLIGAEARVPAGLEGVRGALKQWYSAFPQPQRTEREWLEFYMRYEVVCGHLPTAALEGAMKAWAALPDSEYLPKPGKLRELAQETPTPAFKLYARGHAVLTECERRLGLLDVQARMDRDAVKPAEQQEAVRALFDDFKEKNLPVAEAQRLKLKLGVKGAEQAEAGAQLPSLAGPTVPGSHLTARMLALLGRPHPEAPPAPAVFSEDL